MSGKKHQVAPNTRKSVGRAYRQQGRQYERVGQHGSGRETITSMDKQRQPNRGQKKVLVFDQKDRIEYVKGFAKRKQERRDRAKEEAMAKDREMRRLLRQKRREALARSRSAASGTILDTATATAQESDKDNEDDDSGDAYAGGEAKGIKLDI